MSARSYKVDSNHIGIRVAVLAVFVVTGLVGALIVIPGIINVLGLRNVPLLCLASIGGIALGAAAAWGVERTLMRIWPSGHTLQVDDTHLELRRRRAAPITLRWTERINVLSWYFVVRKSRSWVPRGWICLACHLGQDDAMIVPYTFVSPSAAGELPQWAAFEELLSQQHPPSIADGHQAGQTERQSQLRSAEQDRWLDGCELPVEDFADLIARLDERLPYWPR